MARLPKPGADEGKWADILNEFLLVAHRPDGTLRQAAVSAAAAVNGVGLNDLRAKNQPGRPIRTPILSNNGTDLVWKTSIEINVRDYGAIGDGVTDDTAAVQAAVDAAGSGLVVFPSGVFMIRCIRINNKGTAIRGDGRFGTRIKRHSGTLPLIDMSGSSSGLGHLRYSTISNFQIDGNNLPGVLLRSYYSDTCVYRELSFINCKGLSMDFVEVWDTRFENCTWEHCGSLTEPATLFRNSTAPGTFGYSTDNTNQIHFISCRWEGFRNGAICLDGAANGSTALLNGIFFVSCKMETRLAAGSAFQILNNTTVIFVNQLYIAIMAADPAYTKPIDAIEDHASHLFMTNIYVQWGAAAGLANSVAHIVKSAPHMYHELGTFYPAGGPAKATVWVEPAATDVTFSSLWKNQGKDGIGNFSKLLDSNPLDGLTLPLLHPGSFRITDSETGNDIVKIDNNSTRPALHLLNGVDGVGFSDDYITEKWRIVGSTGAARFAGNKFQIEGSKGNVGVGISPSANISMVLRAATETDRGLAVMRQSVGATSRLLEFQDETYNIQGLSIDYQGRPVAVGTPPQVTPGDQVTYANPGIQVRDIAGNITAAVKPSPTAPGSIARITFSRPYLTTPLSITLSDNSAVNANLYISSRSASSFVVSCRTALGGGALINFDYTVVG